MSNSENKSVSTITNETINSTNSSNFEKVILNENSITIEQAKKSLDNKTIAFIGDSLIEGYGNDYKGFDFYLSKYLPNTSFVNNSKSGSTITNNSGDDNIIMINQARTLQGNPDIIVLDGGANDIIGYALEFLNIEKIKIIGTSENIQKEESVLSDFSEVISTLKERFPKAQICYLQPFCLDDETISHLTDDSIKKEEIQKRRDQFYTEVEKLCKKLNIDYFDISNKFTNTQLTYRQDDWIHINNNGYEFLTPYLVNKLKEM